MCEHAVIGAVDCNGKYTPSGVTAVPSQPASIPVSSARDRNLNFNRAGIFIPLSAGTHKDKVGIVVGYGFRYFGSQFISVQGQCKLFARSVVCKR